LRDIQSKYESKEGGARNVTEGRARYTDEEKHLSVLLTELPGSTGTAGESGDPSDGLFAGKPDPLRGHLICLDLLAVLNRPSQQA